MAEPAFQRYAIFAVVCVGYALTILWLVFRRRLQLQSSLVYLFLMAAFAGASVLVTYVPSLVTALGFALPSNLLFACAIGVLGLLHLIGLINASRLEVRSTTMVQEIALLQQQVDNLQRSISSSIRDETSLRKEAHGNDKSTNVSLT
jgi:hypothetical protein